MEVQRGRDRRFLDPSDFVEESNGKLGSGHLSLVQIVTHKLTKKKYALKTIDLRGMQKEELVALGREIKIQESLDHPHITKLIGTYETYGKLHLVLELAPKGNLYTFLRKNDVSVNTAVKVFSQILSALAYLHQRGFAHRDIKPENVLIMEDNNFKLCDFGFSALCNGDEARQTLCGTKEYLPPEVIDCSQQTNKVDIWCMGILFFELLHKRTPFPAKNIPALRSEIAKGRIAFNKSIPPLIRKTILSCLQLKPEDRPTALQLLGLPIYRDEALRGLQTDSNTVEDEVRRPTLRKVITPKQNIPTSAHKPEIRQVQAQPKVLRYTHSSSQGKGNYSSMIFVENRDSGSLSVDKSKLIENPNNQKRLVNIYQPASSTATQNKPINIYTNQKSDVLKSCPLHRTHSRDPITNNVNPLRIRLNTSSSQQPINRSMTSPYRLRTTELQKINNQAPQINKRTIYI